MKYWTALGAAVIVLALAACGSSTGQPAVTPTPVRTIDPIRGDCRPTMSHIPFAPLMPTYLPPNVKFLEACTHPQPVPEGAKPLENVEIYFYDDARTAWFQVVTSVLSVEPRDRETVDLNGTTGYIIRTPRDDGSAIYGIEMALQDRAYSVVAILNTPGNTLTEADLERIAESMVEAAGR